MPKVEMVTRTAEVRIVLQDKPAGLKEGMSATVNIMIRKLENALIAPRAAVTAVQDKAWVWVVDDNGRLAKVEFKPGAQDETRTEILSGNLKEGMRVVENPDNDLQDGMKVKIKGRNRD
jgi:multidrug efflux pump subunit AcrA (membrane-fusion protein)